MGLVKKSSGMEDESVGSMAGHSGTQAMRKRKNLVMEGEAMLVDEMARQRSRRAIEAVAVVNASNGNATMCNDVTSSQSRVHENSSVRAGPEPFAVYTRMEDKSDSSSLESERRRSPRELGRRGIVEHRRPEIDELSGHRIRGQRHSLENLRAEFNEGLRTQQAMFMSARDELEMRRE